MRLRTAILALTLCAPLLATGCGLLGIGSTAGVIIAVMMTSEEDETEYVYPPEATIVEATVSPAGPEGGRVTAFGTTSAGILFAGTHRGGIYRVVPAGSSTWSAVNTGFDTSLTVSAFAVDTADANRVLVGTGVQYAGGVYRTGTAGSTCTWEEASEGLASLDVRALAAHPTAGGTFFAGTGAGVYRTADGGDTWTAVTDDTTTGLLNLSVSALLVDPANANRLFAATHGGGVFETTNGGTQWDQRVGGLADLDVTGLAFHGASGTLWASTKTRGVWISTDAGMSWTETGSGTALASQEALCVAMDPVDPAVCWAGTAAGVHVTRNAGVDWAAPATAPADPRMTALVVLSSSEVFAGGYSGGVFRCQNAATGGSESFTGFTGGLHAAVLHCIVVEASGARHVGSGADGTGSSLGLLNYATAWTPPTTAPAGNDIAGVAAQPSGALFAAVKGDGVYTSTDNGANWTLAWTGATSTDVLCVAVPGIIANTVLAGCETGAHLSTDNGANWSAVASLAGRSVRDFAFAPASAQIVYAATDLGVYLSTDGGINWIAATVQPVFAQGAATSSSVLSVLVDPASATVVYAGMNGGGVYVSEDSGARFAAANLHMGSSGAVKVYDLAAQTVGPDYTVFAATNTGFFRTADRAKTWNPVHDGNAALTTDAERRIVTGRAVAVDPTSPGQNRVFLATEGRGVLGLTFP